MVLLHFGSGGLVSVKDTSLYSVFEFGQYGIHIFFVISGFIIPFSLYRSGYRIKNFFSHVFRRFIRIDPPAFASILLMFVFYYAAVLVLGRPVSGAEWPGINVASVIGNLTYTVDYLPTSWFNPVFWTLAIEFQYYLLIGLLMPLLARGSQTMVMTVILSVLLLYYVPVYSFFKFGSIFVVGILLFLEREKRLPTLPFAVFMLLSLALCFVQHGVAVAVFVFCSAVFIRHFSFSTKFTDHLGKISFSLYLTHLFSGWCAEIAVKQFYVPGSEGARLGMLVFYVAVAIVFATLFYHVVERFFLALSKKYKHKNGSGIQTIESGMAPGNDAHSQTPKTKESA